MEIGLVHGQVCLAVSVGPEHEAAMRHVMLPSLTSPSCMGFTGTALQGVSPPWQPQVATARLQSAGQRLFATTRGLWLGFSVMSKGLLFLETYDFNPP